MISRNIYKILGSPNPPAAVQIERVVKMVKISVYLWSEDDLKNKFDALSKKGDWDKECEKCKNPEFLHKSNCARKVEVGEAEFSELWKVWSVFRERMELIRKQSEDEIENGQKHYEDKMEKRQNSSDILIGMKQMTDAIPNGNENMCEVLRIDQISW